jgi:hypothetical protein
LEGIMAERGKCETGAQRNDRLAKALRENLKRRKEQQRKREKSGGESPASQAEAKNGR